MRHMNRVPPIAREQLPEHEPLFAAYEQIVGLVPTTLFTLARVPGLL